MRLREVLGSLIELSGLSRREIEKRLLEETGAATDLGRLLSGRLDIKVRHLLDICSVIGLFPQEFFRIVFRGSDERSPLLKKLDKLTAFNRPKAAAGAFAPAADLAEMSRLLAECLRRLDGLASTASGPCVTQGACSSESRNPAAPAPVSTKPERRSAERFPGAEPKVTERAGDQGCSGRTRALRCQGRRPKAGDRECKG